MTPEIFAALRTTGDHPQRPATGDHGFHPLYARCREKNRRDAGPRLFAAGASYFWRIETISMTFSSLPSTVLNTFVTILSFVSMMISSRPLTFSPVSGQHSSLAH